MLTFCPCKSWNPCDPMPTGDFTLLTRALAQRAEEFCRHYLPAGTKEGAEWRVGDAQGTPGHSMAVALSGVKAGCWIDGATSQAGTLLTLLTINLGVDIRGAADEARRFLGMEPYQGNGAWNGNGTIDPLKRPWKRGGTGPTRYASAAWSYHDAEGHVTAHVCRFEDPERPGKKDIIPLRLVDGKWCWKGWSGEEPRPLYNLHLLFQRPDAPVLVVEGEKTAEAAALLFPAMVVVTWVGGCGQKNYADLTPLEHRQTPIIFWPDADDEGFQAAHFLNSKIHRIGRVVQLPAGLPDGWDLADPVPDGVSIHQLIESAQRVADPADPEETSSPIVGSISVKSDAYRAELFINRFGGELRYVLDRDRWIAFDGPSNGWNAMDGAGALRRFAIQFSRENEGEIFADSFVNTRKFNAILPYAQADLRIIINGNDLDSNPFVIGAPNGIIDLNSGELHPHSNTEIVTKFIGTPVNPTARCPLWLAFLEEVIPDPEVRHYIHKAAGYSLTGLTREHHFMFLHGPGSNGKSTFMEVLRAVFGDYAERAGAELLYEGKFDETPPHVIARIAGVRFLWANETRESAKLNEAAVKDITGGDTLHGAHKYENAFDFQPVAKLWFAGNHRPGIGGTDEGIWRRVRLIDFKVKIARVDKDKKQSLLTELPGILNWLIEGCLLWREEGLDAPRAVFDSTAEYRADQDVLGDFISQRVEEFAPVSITYEALFCAYQKWCDSSGVNRKKRLESRRFARQLHDRGWEDGKGTHGARVWKGRRLKPSEPTSESESPE